MCWSLKNQIQIQVQQNFLTSCILDGKEFLNDFITFHVHVYGTEMMVYELCQRLIRY